MYITLVFYFYIYLNHIVAYIFLSRYYLLLRLYKFVWVGFAFQSCHGGVLIFLFVSCIFIWVFLMLLGVFSFCFSFDCFLDYACENIHIWLDWVTCVWMMNVKTVCIIYHTVFIYCSNLWRIALPAIIRWGSWIMMVFRRYVF